MGTYDVFDDDQEEIQKQQGVLGGAAFDEVERVKQKPVQEGYEFTCLCNQCATSAKIVVPWVELITCSAGAIPLNDQNHQPWTMHRDPQGGSYLLPSVYCQRCSTQFPIMMYPEKASKMVGVGISMRVLNPAQVEQHIAHVKQQMGAYRR